MSEYKEIMEGSSKIFVPRVEKISKDLPVFYNAVMKFNRDISILFLNSLDIKDMQIGLPLAGTGVRAVRFLNELKKGKIKSIEINDYEKEAVEIIKKNLELNKINLENVKIQNKDANLFLLESSGFDYIDIDPFGTPNPYLNSAVMRISREGIIAVTATDTSALCGTYLNAGKRKYWAKELRNELMHELGLRILIRKVQLIGAQFNKALTPLFSYDKDHYMRIFFQSKKSKTDTDAILKKHEYFLFCNKCLRFKTSQYNKEMCRCGDEFDYFGPLFVGDLWDGKLVDKMIKNSKDENILKFLNVIKKEASYKQTGFYDVHKIAEKNKLKSFPKKDVLLKKLNASETIFSNKGIKTNYDIDDILRIIKPKS